VRHTLSRHRPRKRTIQYSRAVAIESRSRSVLDTPLSRSMTTAPHNSLALLNANDESKSGGPEAQHAVGFLGGQAAFDKHVIDMRDQLAGGKAHLVHVEHVLVEHHRHQFL